MKVTLAFVLVLVTIATALPYRGPPSPPGYRASGPSPSGPGGSRPGGPGSRRYPGPPVGPPSSGQLPHGIESDNNNRNGNGAPPPGVAVQPMPLGRSPPGQNPRPMDQEDPTDAPDVSREILSGSCTEDYQPYPGNCERFIRCANNRQYPMWCPAGLHFNTRIKVCDHPDNAGCRNSEDRTTTTTATTTSTTTEGTTPSLRKAPLAPGEPDDADCKNEVMITIIRGRRAAKLIAVCTPGFGYVLAPLDKKVFLTREEYAFGNRPIPSSMIRQILADAEKAAEEEASDSGP